MRTRAAWETGRRRRTPAATRGSSRRGPATAWRAGTSTNVPRRPPTTGWRWPARSRPSSGCTGSGSAHIRYVSDSEYLVKGMNEWVSGWQARGWKRKTGPIENLPLWQKLVQAASGHAVEWHWVRGHDGHAKNEYADYLAT